MNFSDFFDQYSLSARVRPALFIVLPIVLTAYILFEPLRTLFGTLLGMLLTCGVVNFFSNQMSSKGNLLQDDLFKKWGGAPSTIILRHSDSHLDKYTKKRYRERISVLLPNFKNYSERSEKSNPKEADAQYISAINFLKEFTRDTNKYSLIFKENISYGFSRNLYAFKGTAITIIILSLIISLVIIFFKIKDYPIDMEIFSKLSSQYYVLIILHFIFLLIWIFMINEEWVKVRAFSYAKRILSACEDIG